MAPPPKLPPFDSSRRRLLTGMAGAAGTLVLPGCGTGSVPADQVATSLPDPAASGIDHIIVVMMENRSFDHYLGWLPGADGKQAGLTYYNKDGKAFPTYRLTDFQNCVDLDPDHSHEGGMLQYNNGACDGFMKLTNGQTYPAGDTFPIGYYTQDDLGFFGAAAPAWTVYDRYFTSIMAETYPNRFYMHSAQTPRMHNGPTQATVSGAVTNPETLKTIWDLLQNAGVSGAYYYNDVPFLGLWGQKYLSGNGSNPIAKNYSSFAADVAAGTLASVVYIDPFFEDEGSGTSKDDHPHADIRDGQKFMSDIYNTVTGNAALWAKTALFFTYDEWGGFFDHVPPPDTGVIPDEDRKACEKEGIAPFSRMGFRVPTIAVSPFARRNFISHVPYDHCSILKMIEWRFGLPHLTVRDAIARNIAESFDFTLADTTFPAITAPAPNGASFGQVCSAPGGEAQTTRVQQHYDEWRSLRLMAEAHGYPKKGGVLA